METPDANNGHDAADICAKVRDLAARALCEQGLAAARGAPIVLMVSGGSDSTALCLVASELADEGLVDADSITVLHVDHGLRGADARGDAVFVQRLAQRCGFAFELRSIDVRGRLGDYDGNVENTGRQLRYAAAFEVLDRLCAQAGASAEEGRVWVAHTQDDLIETFFMRAIVGTGPGGFAALRHRNGRVVRPLLDATRQQLRAYIEQVITRAGWTLDDPRHAQVPGGFWREDATNRDTSGFRAFVRHRLVPLARERNPRLGDTLARTLGCIADESDFMDALVADAVEGRLSADARGVRLGLDGFDHMALPLRRRLIHSLCREVLPQGARIEQRHIELIVSAATRPRFALDLPGGVRAANEQGVLVLQRALPHDGGAGGQADWDTVTLPVPGQALVGANVRVEVSEVEVPDGCDSVGYARAHATPHRIFVDRQRLLACAQGRDDAGGAAVDRAWVPRTGNSTAPLLEITHRRAGDIVCPLGMQGQHKKLSDVLIDNKVPESARDEVLVVRANGQIVWVVGVLVDDRFKATPHSRLLQVSVCDLSDNGSRHSDDAKAGVR